MVPFFNLWLSKEILIYTLFADEAEKEQKAALAQQFEIDASEVDEIWQEMEAAEAEAKAKEEEKARVMEIAGEYHYSFSNPHLNLLHI